MAAAIALAVVVVTLGCGLAQAGTAHVVIAVVAARADAFAATQAAVVGARLAQGQGAGVVAPQKHSCAGGGRRWEGLVSWQRARVRPQLGQAGSAKHQPLPGARVGTTLQL